MINKQGRVVRHNRIDTESTYMIVLLGRVHSIARNTEPRTMRLFDKALSYLSLCTHDPLCAQPACKCLRPAHVASQRKKKHTDTEIRSSTVKTPEKPMVERGHDDT
jgi:hypothetical protein